MSSLQHENQLFVEIRASYHHRVSNTPVSYSEGSAFISRPGDRLNLFRFFMRFLISSQANSRMGHQIKTFPLATAPFSINYQLGDKNQIIRPTYIVRYASSVVK